MDKKTEIVKKGFWLYDNEIKKPIEIIKQNWVFYYEDGYDDELPDVNENGEAFYVLFDEYSDIRYANRSQTCFSLIEAVELAESKVRNIVWE